MIDLDTFLTTLYVMVDDFCQSQAETESDRPGPHPALSVAEVGDVVAVWTMGQFCQRASLLPLCRRASASGLS